MPFNSVKFRGFAKEWNIELHSSPIYPRWYGQAEKAVGIMKKCKDSNTDFNLALLNYRTTHVCGINYTPAQMLMSRNLRSKIPWTLKIFNLG